MLLEINDLQAGYGAFQALFGVDLAIEEGETVAIMGANGAGKSTLINTIAGGLKPSGGAVRFKGRDCAGLDAPARIASGVAVVPEGRRLFSSLSVEENLLIGAHADRLGYWRLETVQQLFPILKERRHQAVRSLSGGQQQMVAIGRALMANPDLLLCDELSLGLAPTIIKDIYAALDQVRAMGVTTVLVEQSVDQALAASDRAYCITEGRIALSGRSDALSRDAVAAAYFGATH